MPINRQKTEFELTAKDKTRAVLKGAEGNFKRLDGAISKLGIGFTGLAGATGIGALIVAQARGAKQTLAYSDALGVSTEALSAWQFAGESVGLASDKIADIMKGSAEKIADAFRNNAGEAKEALEGLNLSIEDMAQLSPDKQLLAIAGALDQVGTQGEKVQVLESLGNDASLLLPLLKDSGAELKRLIEISDTTGNTLTRIEAEKLDEVNESARELKATFLGLQQDLTGLLAPALTSVIRQLSIGIPKAVEIAGDATTAVGTDMFNFWSLFADDSEVTSSLNRVDDLSKKLVALTQIQQRFASEGNAEKAEKFAKIVASTRDELELLRSMQNRLDDILEGNKNRKPMEIDIAGGQEDAAVGGVIDDELQKQFDKLNESLKSEEQRIAESHLTRQQILVDAQAAGIESIIPFDDLKLQLAAEHEQKLTDVVLKGLKAREKFQILSAKNQTKQVLGELTALTAGVAQHNKALFEINKVAGIAQATINTYEGVTKTLSAYPQPLAGILAATHLAAGLAQISAIQSTSFGGGGSAPSLAGSGGGSSTVNTVPVAPDLGADSGVSGGSQITINIEGNVLSTQDEIRAIVVEAIETAEANDEIRLTSNG